MGKRNAAKCDCLSRCRQRCSGPTIGGTDGENELLNPGVLNCAEGGCKLLRTELLPPTVGQQERRTRARSGIRYKSEQRNLGREDSKTTRVVPCGTVKIEPQELGCWATGSSTVR